MSNHAVKYVNDRFDIREDQKKKLAYFKEHNNIPPSAIVRLALDCFFPRLTNMNFKEEGIKRLWNDHKF